MDEKRKGGRPVGKAYPVLKQVRLSEKDAARLKALAEKSEEPEATVLRRALRLLARQEGVEE